ncbi:dihydropyrimidinase [Anaerococcus sp. AGMB09787]|uniref:dihydropyrimidinase n=1 Tax=Anaerococcus sp. AGMB09787 TaxID=2922869 RepID=UPI001FAFC6DE|nr:dihydropyrimidinase [Anaerococcus sp. AGMB09787]
MHCLIRNGQVLTGGQVKKSDILIEDEKIKEVDENIDYPADEIIDAKDKLVIPGGVDVHTHMNLDLGKYVSIDDFYSGSLAASYGGTTTIVDHIGALEKGASLKKMIDHYHDLADGRAVIDYSFHGALYEVSDELIDEIAGLYRDEGVVSVKIYTTYSGKLDDDEILRVLKKAKETGTVVCVHCENDKSIEELRKEAKEQGNLDPIYHAKTRPPATEAEAINRLAYLSELAGYPKLYIVHTSTKEGLEEIKLARKRGVKNLYCETCTQYLTLDESYYYKDGNAEGIKYIMAPPLRKTEDIEALWQGIIDGDVDVIATDHCPFYYGRDKSPYKDNFLDCPGGGPGVEERMEVVISEGLKRNIPLAKLIDLLSYNPAKIFGMGHIKGQIKEGFDADIVILANNPYTISQENRHSNCDYTSYEGFVSNYKVHTVISRGELILTNGKYSAKEGRGKFIYRKF